MARSFLAVLLVTCLLLKTSVALQVTPNSECASVCIDEANQDKSDPNASNTEGSDIVCRDDDYSSAAGQKFEKCVSCLQKSKAVASSESDLQWFLYNLRFAVTSCIFGLANATDPISTPCSIQSSCGSLVGALQDGMDRPQSSNRYSYCTAFGGSFLGNRLAPCTKCLMLTNEQKYMGNFMVALRAGCEQQPEDGTLLSLEGNKDLFSKNPINVETPIATSTPVPNKGGLPTGGFIGIGVAGLVVIILLIATIFVCIRKRRARKNRERLSSDYDERFGNKRITGPVPGAYNDPYVPKSAMKSRVGLVQVPPRTQIPFWARKYQPQTEENSYSPHRPQQSPPSRHIEMSRRIGVASPYHPDHVETPSPPYSPPVWTPPGQTPASHTSSPTSTAHSRTRLNRASTSESESNHIITPRSNISPMIGAGLPKPILPTRNNSNATATSSYPVRPGRHTRDLSVGRGAVDDRSTSNVKISGPIITVATRFDEKEEAKKRRDRETLYRKGFMTKEEEKESSDSEEMWPGNY